MRIFFDQNVPVKPKPFLNHEIRTARQQGWDRITNGALLSAAEQAGFHVFVTGDKNLHYQQNLTGRSIALVILGSCQWPIVRPHVSRVIAAIEASDRNSFVYVDLPLPPKPRIVHPNR